MFWHLLIVAALAIQCQATRYRHPTTITANEPTRISVDQQIAPDSELRDRYNAYRLYLALEPPGWGIGPACYLFSAVRLDSQNLTITIPADVVPNQTRVLVSTALINSRNSQRSGFGYGGYFRVAGANGTWSQRELGGRVIGSQDDLSCEAYGCARRCYDGANSTNIGSSDSDGQADACVKQCARDLNPRNSAVSSRPPKLSTYISITLIGLFSLVMHS